VQQGNEELKSMYKKKENKESGDLLRAQQMVTHQVNPRVCKSMLIQSQFYFNMKP
jgi:hypothetical protein